MYNSKIPIDFAKKISKKTSNYNESSFNSVWENAYKYDKLTMGTLKHYSRISNQEKYYMILAKEKKISLVMEQKWILRDYCLN